MVGRQSERIRKQKRQFGRNAEPSCSKRQKDDEVEPSESADGDEMKITGLNADCHEHIFKYLSLVDLLNVADARKSLKDGIDQAFRSKYGKSKVKFNFESNVSLMNAYETDDEIEILDFVTGLKFLRCFGELNSTLMLAYGCLQQNQRLEMDNYLSGYCTETLSKFTFLDVPKGAIAGVNEPFINCDKLCVHNGVLGRKLSDFSRWFPKVQFFELADIYSLTNSLCIEVHLPQLRHLAIKDTVVQAKNIANCLRLNPQLQTLRISNDDNLQIVLEAASGLLQLEELYIRSYEGAIVCTDKVVHFKNVKHFELNYYVGTHPLPKIPLSFDRIEECSVKVQELPSSDLIKQFIDAHPSIERMAITFDTSKITDGFASIEELMEMESMKTWNFGPGWHSSIKRVGNYYCCIEFKRNILD